MTINVATRSSGTPPLMPPGGRHKSRKLGNSGRRVARATAVAAWATATETGIPPPLVPTAEDDDVKDLEDDDDIPPWFPEQEEGI